MFSALGLREGFLYSQLSRGGAISRPARRGRAADRPAAGARARFRAGAGRLDGRPFSRRDAGRDAAARRGLRAFRHRLARSSGPARRGELSPPAAISVHRHRSQPSGSSSRRPSTPATPAGRTRPGSAPAIKLLSAPCAAARRFSGAAILLAYRFSGGVPAVLAGARLRIEPDWVRLEVGAGARARQRSRRRPARAARGGGRRAAQRGRRRGRRSVGALFAELNWKLEPTDNGRAHVAGHW